MRQILNCYCARVKENDPKGLRTGIIGRRGLVGIGVAFLEEVCPGGSFEISEVQGRPSASQSFPAACQSRRRTVVPSPAPCLAAHNGLTR